MNPGVQREPLSPEERTLADALARLPAVEPSPAQDARVLAQARAALQTQAHPRPRRRPQPWWLSASLGTAAAAVLAAGVAWQAGIFDIDYGNSVPVPRSRAPMAESPDVGNAVDIDLGHRAAPTPPAAPVPQSDADIAPAIPSEPPAPEPAAAPRAAGAPEAASLKAMPPALQEEAPAPAPPARTEPRREQGAIAPEGIAVDTIRVSGARLKVSGQTPLPHWREDALLDPEAWLERVRERLLRGDRPGAVQSLRQFQHKNPSRKVPDDLVRLLAG